MRPVNELQDLQAASGSKVLERGIVIVALVGEPSFQVRQGAEIVRRSSHESPFRFLDVYKDAISVWHRRPRLCLLHASARRTGGKAISFLPCHLERTTNDRRE